MQRKGRLPLSGKKNILNESIVEHYTSMRIVFIVIIYRILENFSLSFYVSVNSAQDVEHNPELFCQYSWR
jgi:hypothetical protein